MTTIKVLEATASGDGERVEKTVSSSEKAERVAFLKAKLADLKARAKTVQSELKQLTK